MRKLDPRDLYEITGSVPASSTGQGPVLLHALDGFVDAGRVVDLLTAHLLRRDPEDGAAEESAVVARFDVDQLHDYRARRPPMRFEQDHFASVDMPELVVHALTDAGGQTYLLLSGPEPDAQWERFTAACTMLVRELGARLTVGLSAFPLGVPHTRPTHVVLHSGTKELLAGYEPWLGSVLVPGAMTNLLELRLGEAGLPALGLAATVPQYLVQSPYPAGAVALLQELSARTGLLLPLAGLETAAAVARKEVDEQVAQAPEVQEVIHTFEVAYDAAAAQRSGEQASDGMPSADQLPSADELGAELERFLAEQSRGDGA